MTTLYVSKRKEAIEKIISTEHVNSEKIAFDVVSDVYVLPCKQSNTYGANIVYSGGVADKKGAFIAGLSRHTTNKTLSYSVTSGYIVDESTDIIDTAIFGGVLIEIFGHTITETISRLWFVKNQHYTKYRILFVNTGRSVPQHFLDIIELLGISERVTVVTSPLFVRTLYVPQQSIVLYSTLYKEYFSSVYEIMKLNAGQKKLGRKLYLTRSHFSKNDCLGEQVFEEIFENNGYDIVALEQYPLREQISILGYADEIATTIGTLSHMSILFCKDSAKLTFFLRENESGALTPQLILNKLKNCEINIVDATYNFLPTTHAGGIFLLYPNDNFKEYAKNKNIKYDEKYVKSSFIKFIPKYITQYANNYSRCGYAYKRLKNLDFFDIIRKMSEVVLDKDINRKDFFTESKVDLQKSLNIAKNIIGKPNIFPLNQYNGVAKHSDIVKISVDDEFLCFAQNKILISRAREAVLQAFPILQDYMIGLVPILYTGLYLSDVSGDYLYFENSNKSHQIKKDELRRIACSDIDCVFHQVKFSQTIENQYKACHGSESWDIVKKQIAKDMYLDSVAKYYGYNQKFLFDKNCGCIRKKIFKRFFPWYFDCLSELSKYECSVKYLHNISERLITIYFLAQSFKNICICYYSEG